jgi:hypothetical protein
MRCEWEWLGYCGHDHAEVPDWWLRYVAWWYEQASAWARP